MGPKDVVGAHMEKLERWRKREREREKQASKNTFWSFTKHRAWCKVKFDI